MAVVEVSPPNNYNYCPHLTEEEIQVKREMPNITKPPANGKSRGQTRFSLTPGRPALTEPLQCSRTDQWEKPWVPLPALPPTC